MHTILFIDLILRLSLSCVIQLHVKVGVGGHAPSRKILKMYALKWHVKAFSANCYC